MQIALKRIVFEISNRDKELFDIENNARSEKTTQNKTMTSADFKAAREKLGYTQGQFADALEITRRQASKMELGQVAIREKYIDKIENLIAKKQEKVLTLTTNTANFAFLLDFYGCKTLKQLAQKMGFDPKNADKWALSENVPQHVLLKFEIDKRCANGQPIGDALASVMQAKTICVNYYPSLSISAGYGIVANEAAATRVELQQVLLEGLMIENVKCLNIVNVCGDSMLPILHDGDKILVEHNCAARNGDCVVAIIENELVVKELERHPLGHWVRLHSKNEKYRDIELEGQEVEKMRIVGIVRAIIRTMGRKV